MPKTAPDPDDLSREEEAELDKFMGSEPPPPDDSGEAPATSTSEAEPPADPEPPAEKPAGEGEEGLVDPELAAFLEKHNGKSSEELATLAYQQQKRATTAAYDGRQTQQRLQEIVTRAQQARETAQAKIEADRKAFEEQLQSDPDAAMRAAQEQRFAERERQVQAEADARIFEARQEEARALAAAAIPDFARQAPVISGFAINDMNFTPEEIERIDDGRMVVTLYLASLAGRHIKAGTMDATGRFLAAPEASATPAPGAGAQPPRTLSSAPKRAATGAKTLEQQLADIANLNDADFEKAFNDPAVQELLKQAG